MMCNVDCNMEKITASAAAQHFKVTSQTIRRWIQLEKLTGYKSNGQWYVEIDKESHATDVQQNNKDIATQQLQDEVKHLRQLLDERGNEVKELHQIIAMEQKSIQQLTKQNQLLLEDKSHPWWKRIFHR